MKTFNEEIKFIAHAINNSNIKISAESAKEAVELFLKNFKSQKFSVTEYRNGCHQRVICGNGSYFYKKFLSRKEAINFLN